MSRASFLLPHKLGFDQDIALRVKLQLIAHWLQTPPGDFLEDSAHRDREINGFRARQEVATSGVVGHVAQLVLGGWELTDSNATGYLGLPPRWPQAPIRRFMAAALPARHWVPTN